MKSRIRIHARGLAVALIFGVLLTSMLGAAACNAVGERNQVNGQQKSDGRPARIISLSPSATEILYGVGAFDRVVAVSNYCDYPAEVERLPRVGGWDNPQLEKIVALRPDLVVFAESSAPFVKDELEKLGLKTLSVPSKSLEDVFTAIEQVGHAVGNDEEGRRLAAETRAKIEEVRARTASLPKRKVLCVVDRKPGTLRDIYSATEGSFIAQLIEIAGSESIAPPAEQGWGLIQKEAIVALDPEIIIDLMMQKTEGGLAEDTQLVWRDLPQLGAVREGRVYALRDTKLIHPSQFVGDAARKFAELIHPEAFAGK